MSLNNLFRLYRTLKYLKITQIKYQIWYRLKKQWTKGFQWNESNTLTTIDVEKTQWIQSVLPPTSMYKGDNLFTFLNLEHQFQDINWNEPAYGKLWTYNLTYFEFLLQNDISVEEKIRLLMDFFSKKDQIKDGFEPYPISLRTIFTIRFLIENKIKNPAIDQLIYQQLLYLSKNIEYHLLGNHLLENGYAFLFGSVYFKENKFQRLAEKIIQSELEEQTLNDGAHFELSPMYHQIILYRLLDCINLLENTNNNYETSFKIFCKEKAASMLAWLQQITFKNGNIPMLNDATKDIAPSSQDLLDYASRLKLTARNTKLKESGYRKYETNKWELLVDVGDIGPDYIPGHAHSDTFNFVLHHKQKPIIIDTGISTYDKNNRRQLERSTSSHNTVMLNDKEQSEIWGGFRVGRRAKITELKETANSIETAHDGYQYLGIKHKRSFHVTDERIVIIDEVEGGGEMSSFAYFHLHKDVIIKKYEKYISLDNLKIVFKGDIYVSIQDYEYSKGYNVLEKGREIKVEFNNRLETKFI